MIFFDRQFLNNTSAHQKEDVSVFSGVEACTACDLFLSGFHSRVLFLKRIIIVVCALVYNNCVMCLLLTWRRTDFVCPCAFPAGLDFDALLIKPKEVAAGWKLPLVVVPHGWSINLR